MHLTMENLKQCYDKKVALNVPFLEAEDGDFIGVIGPNGAGKSTLIKLIAGMEPLCGGSILYNGKSLKQRPEIFKEMTLIFQKPYLLRRSVLENLSYPLKLRNLSKERIRIKSEELLKELSLWELKDQKATTLSGGEAQKLALARALVFDPALLMLDEPTANIDPQSVLEMERVLKNFHKRTGATILMITHNIQQAKRLSQKVWFLDQGRLIEEGSTKKILNTPKDPLTKRFIHLDNL